MFGQVMKYRGCILSYRLAHDILLWREGLSVARTWLRESLEPSLQIETCVIYVGASLSGAGIAKEHCESTQCTCLQERSFVDGPLAFDITKKKKNLTTFYKAIKIRTGVMQQFFSYCTTCIDFKKNLIDNLISI